MPQRLPRFHGLSHASLAFATIAANPDLPQIPAGSAFLDPHLPAAIRGPAMREVVPIQISDVTIPARSDKANGNHRASLLVVVDKLSLRQSDPFDQHPCPDAGLTRLVLHILDDKPFWELPGRDARLRNQGIVRVG